MDYKQLIELALKGRSVNSTAKQWGVKQPTLDRYVKGESLPDYDLAEKIFADAGVSAGEGFAVLAETVRIRKSQNFRLKKQQGFVQIGLLTSIGGVGVVILSILC